MALKIPDQPQWSVAALDAACNWSPEELDLIAVRAMEAANLRNKVDNLVQRWQQLLRANRELKNQTILLNEEVRDLEQSLRAVENRITASER